MDDRARVRALIERLVREAKLGRARDRDELRRELESHFEEAGTSPDALRAALERFGDADAIGDGFRRAHRRGRAAFYAAKVLASLVVSLVVAILLQAAASVRVDTGAALLRLAPGYFVAVPFSAMIIVVLVAAWELDFEPLCVRLERRPLRLLATLGALFTAIFLTHLETHELIAPATALLGSATTVAVWVCTVAIISRLDLAFMNLLAPKKR